jgi:hypothetical protein
MPLQPLQSATAPRPARLVEPIIGLLVQEIESDGVFRHFFGDDRANH